MAKRSRGEVPRQVYLSRAFRDPGTVTFQICRTGSVKLRVKIDVFPLLKQLRSELLPAFLGNGLFGIFEGVVANDFAQTGDDFSPATRLFKLSLKANIVNK